MGYSLKKISKKIMFIFIAFISMFIYIGNAKAANVGDKYYLTYKYNTNPTGGNPFTYYNNKTDYNYYDINQQLDWSTNFKVEVVVRYDYSFQKIFLVGTEKIGGTTSSNNGLAISLTDDARVYVEAAGRSATSTSALSRQRIKVLFEWDASNNIAKTTVYEYSGTSFDSGRSFSFTTYPITTNSHSYSAKNLRIGRGYEDSVPYKLLYESFDYSKQYSYDPNNGAELIAPTRINRGYVFRRWCSSSSCNNVYGDSVIMDSDKTAYSQYYSWNVDSTAGTPYMYGGETKIYGSGETIITTNVNNLDYPPGVNKYYSCGYSTDGTNFDHFTEPSTNNTFVVGATEYLGTRNYACYAYASDGFDSSPIMFVVADPDYYQAIVTILLPSIDFNTGDGVIPGDTARFYGKYNTSNLYDTETGDNIVDVPIGFLDGHEFLGWYTSDDSSGEKIIDAEGNFVPNVSGWTNEDGKFIKTSNSTLYAKYKEIKEAYLIPGQQFNNKLNKNVTGEFRKATLEEYNLVRDTLTNDNIVSTSESPYIVYLWSTDNDILYYTDAEILYVNENAYKMFSNLSVTSIDLNGFDTSNTTNMSYMFNTCSEIEELDLSSFDTSSANDIKQMFRTSTKLRTIYVSDKWDVSNVPSSAGMFWNEELIGYYGWEFYWYPGSGYEQYYDKTYAKIDTEDPDNRGYLTDISHKGETHTITYSDGVVETYPHNYKITIRNNNLTKDSEKVAELTLKYHDDVTPDTTMDVIQPYYASGWIDSDGNTNYYNKTRLTKDLYLEAVFDPGNPITGELPIPEREKRLFLGWYTEEEDGEEVFEYSEARDATLHAHWSEELLEFTVDGKTTLVEPGYVYTIPHGIPTENSDYITIYLEDSYNQDNKEVKISYGNAVNYQIIKGTKYYPGDTYVVNEDTDVISNKSKDKTAIMDPYVEEPTYHDENGDYVFKGWILANWDYADPIDVNIDIYSLTPDDVLFDNQTFLADFEQINEEEQVRLTIIDDYKKNNYTYIVPKGLEIHPTDIDTDLHNSRRMYIENNINDDSIEYNYEIDALISHYLINDEEVPNEEGITRTINEDTTIEVVRVLTENEYCNDHETCPSIIYTEPYSRVSFDGVDNYIYTGIYVDSDGNGRMFNLSSFKPTGDPNGSLEGTVYMHFIDGTDNIILTVDEDVSIIPKGMGVIPEAKEKADDVIPITLVYQDNETPNGVANMTYKHTFEGYKKQDYWRVYNPGEEYDYEEDTYFYSSYNNEWIFDEFPEIDDDHFKGWWTEPEGGERVDELEYMRGYYEDYGYDTLYAHWGEPTVEICHGKGDCEEIIKGTAVVLERPEPTVTTAHFTLNYNTEEPGYDPKNVTTTRTETVEYFMINDERYDFGETYVFNENVDMYGVTTTVYTSDFEGYYSDNWDYGLNINGYELRGWCATTDGRYCRYYDEGDDIVQPDGLTLYATYYQSEGDTVKVTVDWNTTYEWPKGESEVLPDEKYNTIDFEVPEDYDRNIYFERNDGSGETLNGSIHVTNEFIGYRVGNDDSRRYQRHDLYTFYKDIHIQSQYDEVYQEITFPEMNEPTFKGWYTRPEGGRKISTTEDFVKYMDLYNEFHLYAQYYEGLPTDMELDTDNVSLMPGETHQIGVIFTPEGSGDTLTYTGYDDTKISVVDGLITGLSEGTTTITVGTENTDIEKTINVTIINGTFASSTYSVVDKEKEDQTTDRIVIGAEPETIISDFKSNLDNPNEYIKIYDGDNELSDDDIVKTGLTIRLEVNGTIYDEAIIIIRGDINQDGLVNLMDKSVLSEQLLRLSDIEGYGVYAADIDNNDSINLMDKSKLSEYLLRLIDTLNE